MVLSSSVDHRARGLFLLCVRLRAHISRVARRTAPWEYCCYFLMLLSGMWAVLLSETMLKTAMSAPGILSASQIQLWAQQGAFKSCFPFSNKKESLSKGGWCVLCCQQAAWGGDTLPAVRQADSQSGHMQQIISFLYLSEADLLLSS